MEIRNSPRNQGTLWSHPRFRLDELVRICHCAWMNALHSFNGVSVRPKSSHRPYVEMQSGGRMYGIYRKTPSKILLINIISSLKRIKMVFSPSLWSQACQLPRYYKDCIPTHLHPYSPPTRSNLEAVCNAAKFRTRPTIGEMTKSTNNRHQMQRWVEAVGENSGGI